MKKTSFWALVVALILSFLSSSLVLASGSPSTSGTGFLKIPIASRASAMAGAFSAVQGDITAIEYNPAGLTAIDRANINATLIGHLEGSSLQSASVGFPIVLTDTTTVAYRNSANPPQKLFVGLQYRGFQDDDTARNDAGIKLEEFKVSDQLLHGALAYSFFKRLSLGIAGKVISRKIQDKSYTTYAFDTGGRWTFSDHWSLGFAVQNIGPSKAFINVKEPLPLLTRIGGAFQTSRFLISGDLSHGRDEILQPAVGVEWNAAPFLAVRGGTLYHTTLQYSAGLGLNFMKFAQREKPFKSRRLELGLDYALRTYNELGITHTATLKILY